MHFSSTDLPVPDPPMMTIDVARGDRQVHPLQHPVGAEGFMDALKLDHDGEEHFGQQVVRGQDQDAGRDDRRFRGPRPRPARPRPEFIP